VTFYVFCLASHVFSNYEGYESDSARYFDGLMLGFAGSVVMIPHVITHDFSALWWLRNKRPFSSVDKRQCGTHAHRGQYTGAMGVWNSIHNDSVACENSIIP